MKLSRLATPMSAEAAAKLAVYGRKKAASSHASMRGHTLGAWQDNAAGCFTTCIRCGMAAGFLIDEPHAAGPALGQNCVVEHRAPASFLTDSERAVFAATVQLFEEQQV